MGRLCEWKQRLHWIAIANYWRRNARKKNWFQLTAQYIIIQSIQVLRRLTDELNFFLFSSNRIDCLHWAYDMCQTIPKWISMYKGSSTMKKHRIFVWNWINCKIIHTLKYRWHSLWIADMRLNWCNALFHPRNMTRNQW